MRHTSAELKRIARSRLTGHYGIPMGAMVVAGLISSALLLPFSWTLDSGRSTTAFLMLQLAGYVIGQLAAILYAGVNRIHLALARGENPAFTELFSCFTRRPDRFILASLLPSLLPFTVNLAGLVCLRYALAAPDPAGLFLLGFLLVLARMVLETVISLYVCLVELLLAEHDSMEVTEAFRQSFDLMKGNKGRYFYIKLSFIGWDLLAVVSFYLGYLWLRPYASQTLVSFYRDVKGEPETASPGPDEASRQSAPW